MDLWSNMLSCKVADSMWGDPNVFCNNSYIRTLFNSTVRSSIFFNEVLELIHLTVKFWSHNHFLREKTGKIKRQPRAYTQLCTSHLLGGTCAVASELAHSWERNASRKSFSFQHLPVTHLLWFQNHPSVEYSAKSQCSIIAHRKPQDIQLQEAQTVF